MFHRVLQGVHPKGETTLLHFPSSSDPSINPSRAPFLTLRVATP